MRFDLLLGALSPSVDEALVRTAAAKDEDGECSTKAWSLDPDSPSVEAPEGSKPKPTGTPGRSMMLMLVVHEAAASGEATAAATT